MCSFIWSLFLCLPILAVSVCLSLYQRDLQRLCCSRQSEATCDQPWATCLKLTAIHRLWSPLLVLGACGKDQAEHQGQLFPAPGPVAGWQKSQSTQRSAFSAGSLLGLVTEIASSCTPQQGLSSTDGAREILVGGAIASPPG